MHESRALVRLTTALIGATLATSGLVVGLVGPASAAPAGKPVVKHAVHHAKDTGWRITGQKDTGWRVTPQRDTGW